MEIDRDLTSEELSKDIAVDPQILNASGNLEDHPVSDVVSVEVVESALQNECDLWIGFKRRGAPSPVDYLNGETADGILMRAIRDGINVDDTHVLLTDTSHAGFTYRFLLSDFPEGEFREKVIWDQEICKRFASMKISSLGIYFSDVVFGKDSAPHDRWVKAGAREFLIHFIASVVEFSGVKKFKILIGENSYNDILNSVLMLKQDLESRETSVELVH